MTNRAKGHIAALFTIFVWAMTFVSIKVVLDSFTGLEVTFIRLIIAYVSLVLFSLIPQRKQARSDVDAASPSSPDQGDGQSADVSVSSAPLRREISFFLAGLFGVTGYFLLQNIGMAYTTATNTSIILNTVPIFTALLAWIILKDKTGIHPLFFLGFLLAMAGIVLISLNDGTAGLHLRGDLLILLAAIIWGCYTLITPSINRYGYSGIRVTRHVHFWALIQMIPFMIISRFHPNMQVLLEPKNLLNLLFLGVIASAVCFVTWNYAVRELGSVTSSIYIYGQPIITVIASTFILGEKLTVRLLIGIVLIFVGVILSAMPGRKRR